MRIAMANPMDRRSSFRLLVTLALALGFFVFVGLPANALGNFYAHLDSVNESIRSGDVEVAKTELTEVTGFYDASRAWGLQWFADAYLFRDAFLQRAAYVYLAGDYQTVVDDLKDKIDDPRAAHLIGCAKFRIAQRRYRAIAGRDSQALAQRAAIIQEVKETVNPDFERALRADASGRFSYKWNYDLTSDVDAIRRALAEPRNAEPRDIEKKKAGEVEVEPYRPRRG